MSKLCSSVPCLVASNVHVRLLRKSWGSIGLKSLLQIAALLQIAHRLVYYKLRPYYKLRGDMLRNL